MEHTTEYAIVIKSKSFPDPWLGQVKPYLKEQKGKVSISIPNDFPNQNTIFVYSGYETLNEKFDDGELFRIRYDAVNPEDRDINSPTYNAYRAHGRDAEGLKNTEFFHVIDENVNFEKRQISSLPYKPTRDIFIEQKILPNYLFGPFRHTHEQNLDGSYTVFLEPYPKLTQIVDSSNNWFILKVKRNAFEVVDIELSQKIWLCSIREIADITYEIVDFISDEQLVKWANEFIPSEARITNRELKTLKQAIQNIEQQDSIVLEGRKNRALELFAKLDIWKEDRSTLIREYLVTEEGQTSIEQYLNANQQTYEAKLATKYSDLEVRYKNRISSLIQEIQEKGVSLDNLETKLQETKDKVNQRQQQELDKQRLELKFNVENLRNQQEKLKKELDFIKDIKNLKEEVAYQQRRKEEIERENSNLTNQRNQLSREIQENQNELLKKLTDLKSYIDVLNGLEISSDATKQYKSIVQQEDIPNSLKEFILDIQANLRKYNRNYSIEELTNYLISIHQSFFTIFAGLPGIGKTSLVTYLSKSLGMESNERFLFIPVARGWTSQKNLLGFFNPLNGKFQPSATGMYEILQHIQNEEPSYPYWFLLDEANLSPLEHYWSSFMAMCDSHRKKDIQLGDPNNSTLTVPNSVRFIATINNDNTTELLSPRIIDRAPIITLQSNDMFNSSKSSVHSNLPITSVVSQDTLSNLFTPDKDGFDTDEERVFDEITSCLSEGSTTEYLPQIIISPRKRNMIENYCAVARDIMGEDKYALRSLDIAISQLVLPIINGNGELYRNRLDKLAKVLDDKGLTYSFSMLQQIIMIGENQYQFYRFLM